MHAYQGLRDPQLGYRAIPALLLACVAALLILLAVAWSMTTRQPAPKLATDDETQHGGLIAAESWTAAEPSPWLAYLSRDANEP